MSAAAPKQERLGFPPVLVSLRKTIEGYRDEIRQQAVALVRRAGKQEAVGRGMGVDPGNFSKMLSGQYALDVGYLADLRALDTDNQFIGFLNRLWGGVFVPQPEMTPEEELLLLKRALDSMGLSEVVKRRAFGMQREE